MTQTKNAFIKAIALILFAMMTGTPYAYGQSPAELFDNGIKMTDKAIADRDMYAYSEGLKLMEKALKKEKGRADWCYEMGRRYHNYVHFGDQIFMWDVEKGLEWYEKGAKLGDVKSALALYKEYKPKSAPHGILDSKGKWNQYFKERDKSWSYTGIALNAEISTDFNDYLALADAAAFTNNYDLANRYAAKAAENKEYGALDYLIVDERSLDYLTSPEIMFEAAGRMWKRNNNEAGHSDVANGIIWFEKSAKAGYPLAQNQMGYIYLNGITVKPDTLKAVSWYKLAANNKVPEAAYALGRLYINGKGIEKDAERGFRLLDENVDRGHIASMLSLGYCCLYGLGTVKDPGKARSLFQRYFDSFNHAPNDRLIFVNNRIIDLDYLIGVSYYHEGSSQCVPLFEASLKGNTFMGNQRGDLLRKLASCHREGKFGTDIDISKAEELLHEALKYGPSEIDASNIVL